MYEVESCIHGFHEYHAVWMSYIGEQLDCALHSGSSKDPFTFAAQKDGETIGQSFVSPHSFCKGMEQYPVRLR